MYICTCSACGEVRIRDQKYVLLSTICHCMQCPILDFCMYHCVLDKNRWVLTAQAPKIGGGRLNGGGA